MLEEPFHEILDAVLKPLGAKADDGEEFRDPPLDIMRYYHRPVRLSPVPILGRALSVVAVVQQPVDIGLAAEGYRTLLQRLALAVNGRYPPIRKGRGLAIGLTTLVLTPEPIGADDDSALQRALARPSRTRAIPLGLFRLNLGQEAIAMALARGPDDLFPEPERLADALAEKFRRYVPLVRD